MGSDVAAGDSRVIRLLESGDVDLGYGDDGAAVVDFDGDDQLAELLPLPGGGAIATGNSTVDEDVRIALARLTGEGEPATGFGAEGEVAASFDTEPPEIAVEGPASGATVDGARVSFTATTPEEGRARVRRGRRGLGRLRRRAHRPRGPRARPARVHRPGGGPARQRDRPWSAATIS